MQKLPILFIIVLALVTQSGYSQVASQLEKLSITGFDVLFSTGGETLVYRQSGSSDIRFYNVGTKKDQLLYKAEGQAFRVSVHEERVLLEDIRERKATISIDLKTKEIEKNARKAKISAVPSGDLRSIRILNGNAVEVLAPLGDQDYINISLSPDKTMVLFRVTGMGSYATTLKGEIIKHFRDAEFPSWYNDHTVLYADIKDNGHKYLSSGLFVEDVNSDDKKSLRISPGVIPLYPAASADGTKIVFNTPENEVYILNVE